ncbi:M14 family metallopeptidase [Pleionea sp. CnH1-48]|uniref:M14 family metallopeptidase n=1 Tax=Pleionea sp. CnH1-48 TaxID=2954494 RepID=UPI0020984D13|nr:M14 family metallopeptidase [Pleionea sp. CnH1-48]MCO7225675.1 M14 family metallopeptidase [Pleionea sp. CnH1-48]
MKLIIHAFCLLFSVVALAKTELSYYFDESIQFDPEVPTPESVLGYQVGDWHVRPEQISEYMYALASTSKRVQVEEMGRSWEQRPLLLVSFSSASNIENLDAIKTRHQNILKRDNKGPGVVWMGYSVHGNEASGANAALLLAYYLAAAQGEKVERLLDNMVILMDPVLNPDGLSRFASWVNQHKSTQTVADPRDLEHNEVWPGGRTNHYWFDLNRDWLLAQHPESAARLKWFHQWKPLVLTDFHEMGTHSTYFFQPGVPERTNPITPQQNIDLTKTIATYHAKTLDKLGSSYYTQENFDDFYYGKGSTYPDVNGAIGILFEQASARGHRQESPNGDVTFPFAIRNQLSTSFSTLDAALEQKQALLKYQQDFYKKAQREARKSDIKAYVYDADGDETRLKAFNDILAKHQIRFYQLGRDLTIDDHKFSKLKAYIVPTQQPQYRLIRALFETQTKFKDNTFYDVSSWTLPLAFNLDYRAVDSGDFSERLLTKIGHQVTKAKTLEINDESIAVALDWTDSAAATVAYKLLDKGIKIKVATKPSQMRTLSGEVAFKPGTLFVMLSHQPFGKEELVNQINDLLQDTSIKAHQVIAGLAVSGIDLGSPSMRPLTLPRPLMVVGEGVNGYEAGEVWHLMDQSLEIPMVRVKAKQLPKMDMSRFTHLILVSGRYTWKEKEAEKIHQWVKGGGHLIASRQAGRWLSKQSWSSIKRQKNDEVQDIERMDYAKRAQYRAEKIIGGAIFSWDVDISHPLAFGLERRQLPVFRRGTDVYSVDKQPFAQVARYPEAPLLSGYASLDNQQRIGDTVGMVALRKGSGSVVLFADNLNFRGFWQGSRRLFVNSLFFSDSYWSSAN